MFHQRYALSFLGDFLLLVCWWLSLRTQLLLHAGFEKPSAIQQKGIVPFTKGLDVIQQAQSGTGKTATFCAGILNNLDFNTQVSTRRGSGAERSGSGVPRSVGGRPI